MEFQDNRHRGILRQILMGCVLSVAFTLILFGGIFDVTLPILGYTILFGYFFVSHAVDKYIETKNTVRLVALSRQDGYRTKATLIARELRLSMMGLDENNESVECKYYKVGFQYIAEDGSTRTCEAIDTYEHKDTAVLIWLNDNVDIHVVDSKYCTIDTDLSQYYSEDIYVEDGSRNIQETDRDISRLSSSRPMLGTGSVIDIIALIVLLYYALDVMEFGMDIGYVYVSPILVVLLVVFVMAGAMFIYKKKSRLDIKKHGVQTYAIGFRCDNAINESSNKYRVMYSYKLHRGMMTVNEQKVNLVQYMAISKLDILPIKVYNDTAIIDMDRIV